MKHLLHLLPLLFIISCTVKSQVGFEIESQHWNNGIKKDRYDRVWKGTDFGITPNNDTCQQSKIQLAIDSAWNLCGKTALVLDSGNYCTRSQLYIDYTKGREDTWIVLVFKRGYVCLGCCSTAEATPSFILHGSTVPNSITSKIIIQQ